ncbi:hypothetical protein TSUD_255610 [Trifolium subterraneum]|uniref:Reverse transcriptase zinc-binding domain-containing protein n=1 Tax=Trifolium subterraneum TaxID=3900 RepID=A0A2Z6NDW8_TRISU|nr:hypothetical protein TSUD_255610 [Trifolium subterraneum]
MTQEQRTPLEIFAFNYIWKSGVPSKVSALSWQLLLDRIPTRDNLWRRAVIRDDDAVCPLCVGEVETARHLFLHCCVSAEIWYAVIRWLGVTVALPANVLMSYGMLVGCGNNKKRKKGLSIIWLAYVWAIWKARNNRVFNNSEVEVGAVLEDIQRFSWKWYLNTISFGPCLLYEWVWNPWECMQR